MELYAKILNFAIPVFFLLVLFETWYGYMKGFNTMRSLDTVSGLSSGVTNVLKDVMGISVTVLSYDWLVGHLAVFQVGASWMTYVIAFVVLDFQGYWVHRWSHEINFFWNKHAIHHSSEEFNLACALRQSISSFVNLFTFFLIPAAILGVPTEVIAIVAPIHLFSQFWYHTRHIGRMGFLEKIIVTPSHHRVHHAINPEYMDKNMSQIFIIWDKLFGTFQEELPDVPPVYGITRPAGTWNPIRINFQHLWLLAQDAWHTRHWRDKLRVWFMPTGWRPADVEIRYPVYKIEDVYHFDKYDSHGSSLLKSWAWVQLVATVIFMMFFFSHLSVIGSPGIFYYGLLIFVSIYSYSELMDKNPQAILWEAGRCLYGLFLIFTSGQWLQAYEPVRLIIAAFLVASLAISVYISVRENNGAVVQRINA